MSTILCLSTNICIFRFLQSLSSPPLKQQSHHSSRNLGFSSSYLPLKPVLHPSGQVLSHIPLQTGQSTLCYRKDQLEFSCSVLTHTHTPSGRKTSLQPRQQMLQPPDIVSVEKKAVCIYGYISAHLYIFDM